MVRLATLAAVVVGISVGGYKLGVATRARSASLAGVIPATVSLPPNHPLAVALRDGHTSDPEMARLENVAVELAAQQGDVRQAADEAARQRDTTDAAAFAAQQAALEKQLQTLESERQAILEQIKRLSDRALANGTRGQGSTKSQPDRQELSKIVAEAMQQQAEAMKHMDTAKIEAEVQQALKGQSLGGVKSVDVSKIVADAMKQSYDAVREMDSAKIDEALSQALSNQGKALTKADQEQIRSDIERAMQEVKASAKSLGQVDQAQVRSEIERAMREVEASTKNIDQKVLSRQIAKAVAEADAARSRALMESLDAANADNERARRLELRELNGALGQQRSSIEAQLKAARRALVQSAQARTRIESSSARLRAQAQIDLLNRSELRALRTMPQLERSRVYALSTLQRTLDVSRGFALMVALNFRDELGLTPHQTTELQLLQAGFLKEFAPIREQFELLDGGSSAMRSSARNPIQDVPAAMLTSDRLALIGPSDGDFVRERGIAAALSRPAVAAGAGESLAVDNVDATAAADAATFSLSEASATSTESDDTVSTEPATAESGAGSPPDESDSTSDPIDSQAASDQVVKIDNQLVNLPAGSRIVKLDGQNILLPAGLRVTNIGGKDVLLSSDSHLAQVDGQSVIVSGDVQVLQQPGLDAQLDPFVVVGSNATLGGGQWTRVVPRGAGKVPKGAMEVDQTTWTALQKLSGGHSKQLWIRVLPHPQSAFGAWDTGSMAPFVTSDKTSWTYDFTPKTGQKLGITDLKPGANGWIYSPKTSNNKDWTYSTFTAPKIVWDSSAIKPGQKIWLYSDKAPNAKKWNDTQFITPKIDGKSFEYKIGPNGWTMGKDWPNAKIWKFDDSKMPKFVWSKDKYFAMKGSSAKQEQRRAHLQNELARLKAKYTERTMNVLTQAQRSKLKALMKRDLG